MRKIPRKPIPPTQKKITRWVGLTKKVTGGLKLKWRDLGLIKDSFYFKNCCKYSYFLSFGYLRMLRCYNMLDKVATSCKRPDRFFFIISFIILIKKL